MKKKLLLYGIIGLLSFSSYSLADNYNSCIGDSDCSSCMCNIFKPYRYNQCLNEIQECVDNVQNDIDNCYSECNDEDCSWCDQDMSMCDTDCETLSDEDYEGCLYYPGNYLSIYDLDYGACYSQYLPGDGNEGGNEGGNVEGIFGNFAPIIDGLKNAIFEFIPYLIYISLGLLGASIGFVGIKWLINRIRSKVFSSFK